MGSALRSTEMGSQWRSGGAQYSGRSPEVDHSELRARQTPSAEHRALVASWLPSTSPLTGAGTAESPFARTQSSMHLAAGPSTVNGRVQPHTESQSKPTVESAVNSRFDLPRLVLEDTLPRDTVVYIISLFFDYVRPSDLLPMASRN